MTTKSKTAKITSVKTKKPINKKSKPAPTKKEENQYVAPPKVKAKPNETPSDRVKLPTRAEVSALAATVLSTPHVNVETKTNEQLGYSVVSTVPEVISASSAGTSESIPLSSVVDGLRQLHSFPVGNQPVFKTR